jgi:hypothetical protein
VTDGRKQTISKVRRAYDYTIAFFERYLNGMSDALVDGRVPSRYEEVTVAARNVAPAPLVGSR